VTAAPANPTEIRLRDDDAASKDGFSKKKDSRKALRADLDSLARLDDVFAARRDRAMLIVLQGMDAAGKDGLIKHVMSGMNPQGVDVYSFRKPSEEELLHDYLWRESKVLPQRGRVAIFNRSYYEEVLVARVEPQVLKNESATPSDAEWHDRYDDINAFERHLTRCGTVVLKFFLHVSKGEQRKRLLKRLQTPTKMWKASDADLDAHERWDAYMRAYEEMLAHTNTLWAPWHVVPADRKWVARAVVGRTLVETFEKLKLEYPEPSPQRRALFARLATKLEAEGEGA
jgi:PPK2 family polyphosphate:nucleotide phosphotransferase